MLNNVALPDKGAVDVKAEDRALTISDGLSLGWQLELPNASELSGIRRAALSRVSVPETVMCSAENIGAMFWEQRESLLRKYERFSHSSTFLNRLANLSEMIGDVDKAIGLWGSAYDQDRDEFFRHKILSAYIAHGRVPEAAERLKLEGEQGEKDLSELHRSFVSLAQGDVASAVKHADGVLYREESAGLNALILAGALAYVQGRYARAVLFFREALRQRDSSSVLHTNLGLAYHKLGETRKCLDALRKAVALGPLNRNAILFYADSLHADKRDAECIGALVRYLQYDQKDIAVLDRLARAQFSTEDFKGALRTLKSRAGIKPEPAVWSNMGVMYFHLKDNARARQYFAQALEKLDFGSEELWLPFTNLLAVLRHEHRFQDVADLTEAALSQVRMDTLAKHPVAFKVIVSHLVALLALDRGDEAIKLAEPLLERRGLYHDLRYHLLLFATSYYSLSNADVQRAVDLAVVALQAATQSQDIEPSVRMFLINNAAFAFLESGRIQDAERALSKITRWIHKESCPTATLGLLNIRKGRVEKGEWLYREAMRLSTDEMLTVRIKQKLSIELAKVSAREGHIARAETLLGRVVAGGGDQALRRQAKEILGRLSEADRGSS
ncbi:MAG: tetratricopeptide repeat protein [Phycisphaerae bacterium]|nr:tetratricopeptide repeat protein [Phycisphaerae bacterium]